MSDALTNHSAMQMILTSLRSANVRPAGCICSTGLDKCRSDIVSGGVECSATLTPIAGFDNHHKYCFDASRWKGDGPDAAGACEVARWEEPVGKSQCCFLIFSVFATGRSSVTVNANTKYQKDIVKRGYNSEVCTALLGSVTVAVPLAKQCLEPFIYAK